MIYKLSEIDEVIARLDNDFNINKGDYVARFPQWVYQCLSDLEIIYGLIPAAHVGYVENYQCSIPDDLQWLSMIEYNGRRLNRKSKGNPKFNENTDTIAPLIAYLKTDIGLDIEVNTENITVDDILEGTKLDIKSIHVKDATSADYVPYSDENYILLFNGNIETSFEEGVIIYHYYKLPVKYSDTIGALCPLIPDNEFVKEAITWYVLMSVLQRGFKHPIYSLNSNNYITNPYLMYRRKRLNARVKPQNLDRDHQKIITNIWNSAMYNVIAKPI